jgi:ABC-type branched-subunit amino acid transport system ATPase component
MNAQQGAASAEGDFRGEAAVLSATDVSVTFGGIKAVQDVSIDVKANEVVGLIGPNGAGKSTLLNIISGHTRAATGTVSLLGEDVSGLSVHHRARRGLARSYQSTTVFPTLTVEENIRCAAIASHKRLQYALWIGSAARKRVQSAVGEALASTRLESVRDRTASKLGHGQARALEVAMLLASGGRVMVLDEPGAGMAAGDVAELTETIRRARERTGASMLIVEHKISLIFNLSDRIAVLDRGRLLAFGTPALVAKDPAVKKAYLGEDPAIG